MDRIRSLWRERRWQHVPTNEPVNMPGHFPESEVQETASRSNVLTSIQTYIGLMFTKPISLLVCATLSVLYKVLQILYFLDTRKEISSVSAGTTINNAVMNDPIRRAENFVRELEENLLPSQQFSSYHSDRNINYLPPFFLGSYTQALYMASSRGKFLYVYLTNSLSEGSPSLFHKVVTNPKFTSIFTDNDQTLIWGGDVTTPEAYQLANTLNITKFPMIGLLCLARTTTMTPEGPKKNEPRISLISKIQGGLRKSQNPDILIHNKFIKRMKKYESDLAVIRAGLRERHLAEVLRKRQDLDYHRSLMKDKKKKEEQRRQKLAKKYMKWRQPYFKQLRFSKEIINTSRVAIKFANGHRSTVLFPKESPIEDVFMFVELQNRDMLDETYESTMSDDDAQKLFAEFKMTYDFKLTSTIPPHPTLGDYELQTPIEQVPFIYPSGLLLVEKI